MAAQIETKRPVGRPPKERNTPAADAGEVMETQTEVVGPFGEPGGVPAEGSEPAAVQVLPNDAYVVDLSNDYDEPQGRESLGYHPDLRVITGSDRPEDMREMAQVALCQQVRPGAWYAGPTWTGPVVLHEELCEKRVQSDGETYLWYDGGPLWMETLPHWEARERARDARRIQKFTHSLDGAKQAIQGQGVALTKER